MAITRETGNTTNVVVNRPLAGMSLAELVTQVEFQYSDNQQIGFEYLSELIMRAEEAEQLRAVSER